MEHDRVDGPFCKCCGAADAPLLLVNEQWICDGCYLVLEREQEQETENAA